MTFFSIFSSNEFSMLHNALYEYTCARHSLNNRLRSKDETTRITFLSLEQQLLLQNAAKLLKRCCLDFCFNWFETVTWEAFCNDAPHLGYHSQVTGSQRHPVMQLQASPDSRS